MRCFLVKILNYDEKIKNVDGKSRVCGLMMRFCLTLTLLLLACAPATQRSPFGGPKYRQAISIAETGAKDTIRNKGAIQIGWAKTEINSPKGVPLGGFGQREGVASEGVLDPCYVRSFAISIGTTTVLIITADLLALGYEMSEKVRREIHSVNPTAKVVFTASHTHSGPGAYLPGLFELALGKYDHRSEEAIIAAILDTSTRALADLAPGRFSFVSDQIPDLVVNRIEIDGTVDEKSTLLFFEKKNSPRRAAIWTFPAHPVTRTYANKQISADYPGIIAAAFENKSLEILAFVSPAVASMNPKQEGGSLDWITDPITQKLHRMLEIAQQKSVSQAHIAFNEVQIPFPPIRYRLTDSIMLLPLITEAVIPTHPLRIQSLRINEFRVLTLPGEISGEIGAGIHSQFSTPTSIWSFNGSYIGYVLPRRSYFLPGDRRAKLHHYETKIMNFLGPWGADYLMNIGARLMNQVSLEE
ncbi:MAG: neutral/alkaline non-lysosomal ceramidase N-terminal domain-containing protein [Myxococcota bacterium]|nr:neutral/alkaline non-lysosomal ceramidase N-terminal domain-containing protein [Myxococcota bacterium]